MLLTMTSLACCSGFVDAGSPTGTIQSISGISYYEALPDEKEKSHENAMIICPDVFGWSLPNVRLLADGFAKALKIPCLVPDMFVKGTDIPATVFDSMQCLTTNPKNAGFLSKVSAIGQLMWYMPAFALSNTITRNTKTIVDFMDALQQVHAYKGFVMQGYCWGGRMVVKLAQGDQGPAGRNLPILAISSNHPGKLYII